MQAENAGRWALGGSPWALAQLERGETRQAGSGATGPWSTGEGEAAQAHGVVAVNALGTRAR